MSLKYFCKADQEKNMVVENKIEKKWSSWSFWLIRNLSLSSKLCQDFYVNSKTMELELLLPSHFSALNEKKKDWWHGILGVGEKMLQLQAVRGPALTGPKRWREADGWGLNSTFWEEQWPLCHVPVASSLWGGVRLTTPYLQCKQTFSLSTTVATAWKVTGGWVDILS